MKLLGTLYQHTSLYTSIPKGKSQAAYAQPQFKGKEIPIASNGFSISPPPAFSFLGFGLALLALSWGGFQYFNKRQAKSDDKLVDSDIKNSHPTKSKNVKHAEKLYKGAQGHTVLQETLNSSPELLQDALEEVYSGKSGAEEKVKLFLNYGSTPNVRNTNGTPALIEALEKRTSKIFNWLINNPSLDVNASQGGRTALDFLRNSYPYLKKDYEENKVEKFKLIERIFAHPKIDLQQVSQGDRLREWLSYSGSSDMVKQLHQAGIDLHSKIEYNQLPLKLLTSRGELESVRYLLAQRPESLTHTPDGERSYIFHAAAGSGNVELIQHLFERGGSEQIHDKNNYWDTPLHLAAGSGNPKAVEWFLKKGSIDLINERNEDQNTPLMNAASTGKADAIKLLLDAGAKSSINVKDARQYTALHYAAASGSVEAVKLLLDAGAKSVINDLNHAKKSPLHIAAEHGDLESLKLLWDNGADKSFQRRDWEWQTILYSAVYNGHNPEVVEFLLNHGAASPHNKHLTLKDTGYCHFKPGISMLDESEAHSRRPVGAAVIRKNKKILELLLKAGAEVNYREKGDNTPLHIAADRAAPIDIVDLLFRYGASQSLESKNTEGQAPWEIAQQQGNLEMIAFMKQTMKNNAPK